MSCNTGCDEAMNKSILQIESQLNLEFLEKEIRALQVAFCKYVLMYLLTSPVFSLKQLAARQFNRLEVLMETSGYVQ